MKGIVFSCIIMFTYYYAFKDLSLDPAHQSDLEEQGIINNCGFSLQIYGAPWTVRFSAGFHIHDQLGDTLLLFKCKQIAGKDSCESKRIYLNKNDQDSLYRYILAAKKNFKLNNYDSGIQDGTKVRLNIGAKSNYISLGYNALSEFKSAGPHMAKLINFINKKLPDDFQLQ